MNATAPFRTFRLMGMRLHLPTYQQALEWVMAQALDGHGGYACFCNVHMTITARDDQRLRQSTNQATLVLTDGKPLCWALKLVAGQAQDRIAGMDFMPSVFKRAAQQSLPIFLLGGSVAVNAAVADLAQKRYPGLVIAGAESPPFRPLTEAEDVALVNRINQSGAKIIMVALGCPKQEIWMMDHATQIQGFMLGLGGAFPVFAGVEKRAPRWAQQLSLEWLYRFIQDPKRLWKRYLNTNTRFLLLLAAYFLPYCNPNGRNVESES